MKNSDKQSKNPDLIQTQIDALAFTGKGVARLDGKVCFINNALPGDLVKARITATKKNFLEAETIEIISKSPHRIQAPCPHAEICGGCNIMQLSYEEQLKWKLSFVTDSLRRIGKLTFEKSIPIFPSPQTLHYRSRITLKFQMTSHHGFQLGYYARSSNEFIPIDTCLLADPFIIRYLASLPKSKLSELPPQSGSIEIKKGYIDQNASLQEVLLITLCDLTAKKHKKADTLLLKKLLNLAPFVAWCGFDFEVPHDSQFIDDRFAAIDTFTAPLSFTQVNPEQNRAIKTRIKMLVDENSPKSILDLCCGNGNLSLYLAGAHRKITGIESNKTSSLCAHSSLKKHALLDCNYLNQTSSEYLTILQNSKNLHHDLVILDPPRAGLQDEIQLITAHRPANILYLSCNPSTLARDLAVLVANGYEIVLIEAFDFFPHTYHVETLAHLTRKKPLGESGF